MIRILGWVEELFTDAIHIMAGVDASGNMRVARHDPSETVAAELAAIAGTECPKKSVPHDVTIGAEAVRVNLIDDVLGPARRVIVIGHTDDTDVAVTLTAAGTGDQMQFSVPPFTPLDRMLRDGFSYIDLAAAEGTRVSIEARYV